jgi:hypothetical protein
MTANPNYPSSTTDAMLEAQRAMMALHDRLQLDLKNQTRMEAMQLSEDEVLNLADICAKYRAERKGPQPRALLSAIAKITDEADRIIQTEHTARRKSQEAADLAYIKGELR